MPNGGLVQLAQFLLRGVRRMVAGDDVERAVLQAGDQGLHVVRGAQRRVHLEVAVEAAQALVGQEVMRADLGGDVARRLSLARRISSTLPAVETCRMCSRPPVSSASAMSRWTMTSSAAAGMPRRPEPHALEAFVHDAAAGQVEVLAVAQDRLVEHAAIFERPPHDLGADDRRIVVGEGDGAPFDEAADLGQLGPARPLVMAPTGKTLALPARSACR